MSSVDRPVAPPASAPQALGVRLGQHSQAGRKAVNQDFHGALVPKPPLLASKGLVLVLADGIGSSDVSQVASEAAVRAVLDDYYATSEAWSVKRSMQRVLAATNSWLHAQTQRSAWRHDMDRGYVCALAALVLKGRTAHVFHAGDVRVWRLAGDTLEQLTEDHRVWVGVGQSYLARALGFQPQLDLEYRQCTVAVGDVFVLSCDGVHEHLPAPEMARLLRDHADAPDDAARAMAHLALARGSNDNLTVQVLRVDSLPAADVAEAQRQHGGLPLAPLLAPRQEFDGYRIERELHASSRSHVYLATELDTGASVVLKTPSVDMGQDEAHLDRFMMEEWIAQRLNSAHVLRPHSRSPARTQARSHLYVAMEFVQGQTLAQWLRDRPQPSLDEVRGIVEQVARGLQAFHRLEMLHQDLRPENIMIDRQGTVKIIDFGSVFVAGLAEAGPHRAADIVGTLQYTAPEYFLGETPSDRSDLFALGVLTYQMLSGRLPYGTQAAMLRTKAAQTKLVYESVLDERRALPAWLDAVLLRAVHPVPTKRFEALSEFVQALHQPSAAYLARQRGPLAERQPLLVWKLLCLALALLALVLAGMLHASSSPRPTTAAGPISPPVTPKAQP